jgi:tetratricopeptide (TPR) repeat protein
MGDNPRIEDLRRRVQKDPASIAFAQLAEELRRSGELQEAVDASLAGLAIHPSYLSARVTLGRALLELNRLDEARTELERVLAGAPENLAARRGLGEIFNRHGDVEQALTHYRAALALAPNDPDLEESVSTLSKRLAVGQAPLPQQPVATDDRPVPDAPQATADVVEEDAVSSVVEPADPEADRARRTVVALEGWLDAVHVSRANRRP